MNKTAFSKADILLPKNIDEKWPVIACDQYTSEPEYWEDVRRITENSPTTFDFILPECYLSDDNSERIERINASMQESLNGNMFKELKNSAVYVERTQSDGKIRKGIIGKINLDDYDYLPGSDAEIRATEKTVVSRIPPRVEIRKNAPLEFPHIMLLIDDPENTVFDDLINNKGNLESLYSIDLMKNGGHIDGYLIDDVIFEKIENALSALKEKNNGFLFCVGDGNHSLATAKECHKQNPNEKNKYALVEVVNIHDTALEFEPIYRIVFDTDPEKCINDFIRCCGGEYNGADAQKFTVVTKTYQKQISVKPLSKLPVGTLQTFLDGYTDNIDYIHGVESLKKLAQKDNAVGFLFEGMKKEELFEAVNIDGSLPRKTFSMGNADDKRFYLEGRKII